MLERDRLKRLAMIKKDDVSWAKYRSSRNIVNVALRKAKSAFYASQIENVTGNPKQSHRYREVTGSNPVEVLNFSGFSSQLLKLRP